MLDIFANTSVARIVTIIVIIVLTIVVSRIARVILNKNIAKSSTHLKVDPTQYQFLKHVIIVSIYILGIIAVIYTIPGLRSLSVSLLAGAGVLAVVIGFASQQAFANIISGVFIVIFKPFRVGDRILVTNDLGIVEDITLRHTVIRNFKNQRVIIPNSIISDERITNSNITDEKIARWIDFSISYDSDIDLARKIMSEEIEKHPSSIDVRKESDKDQPRVKVRVIGFGDSSVNLRALAWVAHPGDGWTMFCDLNESIKKRFDAEGVEIPFPYRTIVYKKN